VKNNHLAGRLFATFLDELEEQLRLLNAELLVLEQSPASAEPIRAIFRVMHTLKGAARAVNVPAVEAVCHALESLLSAVRAGTATLGRSEFTLMFHAADALGDALKRLRDGATLDGSELESLAKTLGQSPAPSTAKPPAQLAPQRTSATGNEVRASEPTAKPAPPDTTPSATPSAKPSTTPTATPSGDVGTAQGTERTMERTDRALRVQSDKLDALFAGVGALTVTNASVAERAGELAALEGSAQQAATTLRRSARQLRRRGAATNESESLEVLAAAEQTMERLVREISRVAAAAARDRTLLATAAHTVSERARLLRMRPFADACEALPRVVRDVAETGGKDVQLHLAGTDVEADRAVLDALREPLLHLVRNAVDHGIEPPDVRARRGKPPQGTVRVDATLRGDRLVVQVTDDGGGIDAAQLRATLMRAGREVGAGDRELAAALLAGGVSTRAEANAISGRGVGLDVARAAVERLGGRLELQWKEGAGTTFLLETPLTLARIRVVAARTGSLRLAVPTADVERLVRLPRTELKMVEGRPVFAAPLEGTHALVPLVSLARLLGPPLLEGVIPDPASVILLSVGGERLGIAVDELQEETEVVVRALPSRRRLSPHVSGAAMLPDGGFALLLDAASLLRAARGVVSSSDAGLADASSREQLRPTVLVVDDSLTTRSLERSVLEAAGYDVRTAVDGADGWRMLEEMGCDLVVADVEMPRMDGFALCEAIRASERHRSIPVVLVTSLESAEHRARGLAAGADAYIGKSSFDQQGLLQTVGRLLGRDGR
jgi:two-component system chemotaxis sensor kinase CheA